MISEFDPIITCCQDLLQNFDPAKSTKEYINNRLSEEVQIKYQFGWFPTNEHLHILEEAVGEELLSKTKTNVVYDRFVDGQKHRCAVLEQHNLVMPYKDVYGRIIGMVGRSILSDERRANIGLSKYKNTSFDKSTNLYGLDLAKKSIVEKGFVCLVEGQMDAISAQENGVLNTIALGSSNMSIEQIALIMRYCDRMVLAMDNDEPGRLGAKKIKDSYGKLLDIRIAELPKGFHDVFEMGDMVKDWVGGLM